MFPPIPILRSFDETETRAFYVDFLGFEIVFEHRFAPGLPLYMSVKRGDCELHLSEHGNVSATESSVRIPMRDVAGFRDQLNAKGVLGAPLESHDQSYGWRDMSVVDPAGNTLMFCEDLDWLDQG